MIRLHFSRPAQADLVHILAVSAERWGVEGRRAYAKTVGAGLRLISTNPDDPVTRSQESVLTGLRSLHLRDVSKRARPVTRPVHIVFYRAVENRIEIVRILHERMDPSAKRHWT